MGERFDLNELFNAGLLYGAAGNITATALVGAQIALVNKFSKGYPIYLFSVRVTVSAPIQADLLVLAKDPASAKLTDPVNLRLGAGSSEASIQGVAGAAPTTDGTIAEAQVSTGNGSQMVERGGIWIPANHGVLVSTPAVAAIVSVSFVWGEIPPSWLASDE
jgi:hypothetical protein